MRTVVIGLGIQGHKRIAVAGKEVIATVDPVAAKAQYRSLKQVSLDSFDAALVCTPDPAKFDLVCYLLAHKKHVLVEKPMLESPKNLKMLLHSARRSGTACYTAYNHRFEPHLKRLKKLLEEKTIGRVYYANFFYGNGTARDVRNSPWRDRGCGVLPDLGSHLLDMVLFLFGKARTDFKIWGIRNFENKAPDYAVIGSEERPLLRLEATLLSWKNTFAADIVGEKGSLHLNGLCKWGPSALSVRKRVLPSGRPEEKVFTLPAGDPTWEKEYAYFKRLCRTGGTNLENDIWMASVMRNL